MDLKGKTSDAAEVALKAGGEKENLKAGDSQNSQEFISTGGHELLDVAGAVVEQGAKGGHSHQRSNRQTANRMLVNGNDGFSHFQPDNSNHSFHQPVTEGSHDSSGFPQPSYDFGERGSSPVTSGSGGQKSHNSGHERLYAGAENQSYLRSGGSKSESLTLNAGENGGRLSSGEDVGARLSTGNGQLGVSFQESCNGSKKNRKRHRSQSRSGKEAGKEQFNTGENTGQLLDSQGEGGLHLPAGMGQDDFKLESGTQHLTFQRNDRLVSDAGSRKMLQPAAKRKQQGDKTALTPNEKKLRDNRKMLQKRLRAEYEVKTELKGGLKSDLRVEQNAKSKLYDAPKFSGREAAADFGKKMLHMADDAADDKNGMGIQNAWIDTADKAANNGMKLINILPDSVKSARLTADWENALSLVAKGEYGYGDFISGIKDMVRNLVKTYSSVSEENRDMFRSRNVLGDCPNCGADVLMGKYGAYCSKKCGMTFGKMMGTDPTESQIKSLLAGKRVLIKGMISKKTGKPYDAYFTPEQVVDYKYTNKEGNEVCGKQFQYKMEFPEKKSN